MSLQDMREAYKEITDLEPSVELANQLIRICEEYQLRTAIKRFKLTPPSYVPSQQVQQLTASKQAKEIALQFVCKPENGWPSTEAIIDAAEKIYQWLIKNPDSVAGATNQ